MANPRNRKKKSRRGYTLIELMVALVVLTLGLFSVIQLQVVSIRGNSFAEEVNQATLIALGVKEQIETQALQWVDPPGNLPTTPVTTAVPGFVVHTSPDEGVPLEFDKMRSVEVYNGCTIAGAADLTGAKRINFLNNTGDTAGLAGEAALYRVHYLAHLVPITRDPDELRWVHEEAKESLIKVQVFVTWLNRNHGPKEKYDWSNWNDNSVFTTDVDSYGYRHMVVATFFLTQNVM